MKSILAWHFLSDDRCLRFGGRKKVSAGQIVRVKGPPVLCEHGLHGSRRAIDALGYAPGSIVCRVRIGGDIVRGTDKLAGTARTILAMADATAVLHEFACWCAERALKSANVNDPVFLAAIETKRRWMRGAATAADLEAARSAAWSAAWTARSAARTAARTAVWAAAPSAERLAALSAAWSAARSEALAAAWGAARSAELSAQNKKLTAMLKKLFQHKGT
jgi:hypothetical protein